MSQNEAGTISIIKKYLASQARARGGHFDDLPLGGQDRFLLADDFFVTHDHFAIIESKAGEKQIKDELKKTWRLEALCSALQNNPRMAEIHARCHRIAWKQATGELRIQSYREAVCKTFFPQTCTGETRLSEGALELSKFADVFFGKPPGYCVQANEFIKYVTWLTKVITGQERDIYVLAAGTNSMDEPIGQSVTLAQFAQSLSDRPNIGPKNTSDSIAPKPRRPRRH